MNEYDKDASELLANFKSYCDTCNMNSKQFGCPHRKKIFHATDILNPNCPSLLMCFAEYAKGKKQNIGSGAQIEV